MSALVWIIPGVFEREEVPHPSDYHRKPTLHKKLICGRSTESSSTVHTDHVNISSPSRNRHNTIWGIIMEWCLIYIRYNTFPTELKLNRHTPAHTSGGHHQKLVPPHKPKTSKPKHTMLDKTRCNTFRREESGVKMSRETPEDNNNQKRIRNGP